MSLNQRLVFSFLEFINKECQSRSDDERESLEGIYNLSPYYNLGYK